MGPAEQAEALLRPHIEQAGCLLYDVEWKAGLLRVSVDREGGVDVETLATVSRTLSQVLDEADPDPVPGRYTLEVSSPGLERPLRTPAHFQGCVGAKVTVRTVQEVEGTRRVDGELESADDEGIVVAGRRIAYGDIDRARTVFEWGSPPRPKPKQKKAKAGS